jgi:hypothetical protein
VGWNPEPFYIMLGESTREGMENPPVRIANRRMLQPGFTKEAMVGYIDKVRSPGCDTRITACVADNIAQCAGQPVDVCQ